MAVINDDFRGANHPQAIVQPAITKVTVLPISKRESGVKGAHHVETICWQNQVIGGKELSFLWVSVVITQKRQVVRSNPVLQRIETV